MLNLRGLRQISTHADWARKRACIPNFDGWVREWEVDLDGGLVGRIGEEFTGGFMAVAPGGSGIGCYPTLVEAWSAFYYYREDELGA